MTAHDWINQHETEYTVSSKHLVDVNRIHFYAGENTNWVDLYTQKTENGVCINLETAEDCINLCKLLRVTPKKKKKKKNGSI